MALLKRSETQALTRSRLLAAARDLFRRDGYAATSVDKIAEAAGYSKGAVYSNFESKEAIFLEVLENEGEENMEALLDRLDRAASPEAVIDLLCDWADARSRSGCWSLTILEHARLAQGGRGGPGGTGSLQRQEEILRSNWQRLGSALLARFGPIAPDAQMLGAMLFEIAYAPALSFVATPRASDIMRYSLEKVLG